MSSDTPVPAPAVGPAKDAELRTIVSELRALVVRLEALIGDGDRR
jgi:hypothetical protein